MIVKEVKEITDLSAFIEQVRKNTAMGRKQYPKDYEKSKEESKKSKRVLELEEAIAGHFGCQEAAVYNLVSVITGEKVEKKPEVICTSAAKKEIIPYSVFVPLDNENSHSYPMGEPSLFMEGRLSALRGTGDTGNNMGSYFRYATDEEITKFFALAPVKKALKALKLS